MRPIPKPSWAAYISIIPDIIASIRMHASGASPTLQSIPQLNTSMMKQEPLSRLIRDMQESDFQRWGFVIYRCAYDNQSQWESYLEFLKAAVRDELQYRELETLLWPLLEWTIVEDEENLDGASKHQVRKKFSQWTTERNTRRDGAGADEPFVEERPRFKYCIYVDQKCLDTVDQYEAWVGAGAGGALKHVVCAILDKDCSLHGRGRRGFPAIEGCVRQDTGWMYMGVDFIPCVYNRLSCEDLAEDYERPPEVWPSGDAMPL
ncbi:hypothetical protein NM208_g4014 [Fusarium decemcellulare]|uniref:Uncharacterized protein n=1 Tax=Fusarium decemcellulare TaxID=57161 RepID=A0ACC1SMF2_9HYPO|nr:hypothetical protein NM208_g4014 [Fusarium decemcellulare]